MHFRLHRIAHSSLNPCRPSLHASLTGTLVRLAQWWCENIDKLRMANALCFYLVINSSNATERKPPDSVEKEETASRRRENPLQSVGQIDGCVWFFFLVGRNEKRKWNIRLLVHVHVFRPASDATWCISMSMSMAVLLLVSPLPFCTLAWPKKVLANPWRMSLWSFSVGRETMASNGTGDDVQWLDGDVDWTDRCYTIWCACASAWKMALSSLLGWCIRRFMLAANVRSVPDCTSSAHIAAIYLLSHFRFGVLLLHHFRAFHCIVNSHFSLLFLFALHFVHWNSNNAHNTTRIPVVFFLLQCFSRIYRATRAQSAVSTATHRPSERILPDKLKER